MSRIKEPGFLLRLQISYGELSKPSSPLYLIEGRFTVDMQSMPKIPLGMKKTYLDHTCFPFLPGFSLLLAVDKIYLESREQGSLGNVVP